MNSLSFKIKGITCPACVKLVERRIQKIDGVSVVLVKQNGEASVGSKQGLVLDQIKTALADTDYQVI